MSHTRDPSTRSDKYSTHTADSSDVSDSDIDRNGSLDIISWQRQRDVEKAANQGQLPPLPPLQSDESRPSVTDGDDSASARAGIRKRKPYIDEYGFYTDQGPVQIVTTQKQRKQLKDKEGQWVRILENWSSQSKRRGKIKKLCRMGIPESMRAKAWVALAGSDKIREAGLFERLLKQEDLPIFDVIERDVDRCFPEHFMFHDPNSEGQVNLRNVLRAYAAYKPEIGYCQGMGMLVGMMLMHMQPEDAFWLLVRTLDAYIPDFFNPSLTQLRIDAAVFEFLLHRSNKRLARHLDNNEVLPLMYITQWFMTIYTTTLPWETTLRIWDMFYCEGAKPLFRIGLAILKITKGYLLKECPTNAELLSFLLHIPTNYLQADQLIEAALAIKLRGADVDRLRAKVAASAFPERGTVSLVRKKG